MEVKQLMSDKKMRDVVCIQFGTGLNPKSSWINTDLSPLADEVHKLDMREDLPFDLCSVDFIYAEHTIEHLTLEEFRHFLIKSYAILKKGGVIRLATPDFRKIVEPYFTTHTKESRHYYEYISKNFTASDHRFDDMYVINSLFHNFGHKFIYDRRTLKHELHCNGFENIVFCEVGLSEHVELIGIESHGPSTVPDAINRFETMIIEGTKPI